MFMQKGFKEDTVKWMEHILRVANQYTVNSICIAISTEKLMVRTQRMVSLSMESVTDIQEDTVKWMELILKTANRFMENAISIKLFTVSIHSVTVE